MAEEKLLKEFEEKFGFKCYEELKDMMAKMYMKIEELKKSRDNWREKYQMVKNESR